MDYMRDDPNIPADVRAVLNELQLEEDEDDITPDEQQLEVLEDIWLKAGEIDMHQANIVDSGSVVPSKSLNRRRKPATDNDWNYKKRSNTKKQKTKRRQPEPKPSPAVFDKAEEEKYEQIIEETITKSMNSPELNLDLLFKSPTVNTPKSTETSNTSPVATSPVVRLSHIDLEQLTPKSSMSSKHSHCSKSEKHKSKHYGSKHLKQKSNGVSMGTVNASMVSSTMMRDLIAETSKINKERKLI